MWQISSFSSEEEIQKEKKIKSPCEPTNYFTSNSQLSFQTH